jgi:hypothetical protein
VERRAYLSYFKDGIADLIAGLPILAFGLGMTFDSSTLFIFAWMPMMLFWPLKHVITRPRFGYVIFSPERRRKISAGMVIMLIAGVFSLLLGVLAFLATQGQILNAREFMLEYSLLMFGVIMAGAFALVALVFQINRFFLHAIFIFAGWLSGYLFDINPGIPVAVSGGLVSVIGLGLLARFIAQYPTVAE